MAELLTERLLLRRWRPADLEPFAAMNADPEVMRYFPSTLTREQSKELVERIEQGFEENGFGWWAAEVRASGAFIGCVGLWWLTFAAPFTPAVEIGWRLARPAWGHGFATEAARAALAYGFDQAGLTEIVSVTAVLNTPSRRVMERLGMARDPAEDFDHPRVPAGHELQRHVLYRKRRQGESS
ncbi:MAG TPA: GNAT family N-acetyltransferase [Dermatophilaceae bacterium]|nr:GNAT family N-acetyltransferase [Dermatophilaceae bacterium]